MKVSLPTSVADIKLHQFQKYNELLLEQDLPIDIFDKKKIEIFTDLDIDSIELISQKDYADMLNQINGALDQPSEFNPTFFIGEVEFGFIPNLDKISIGEYRDLSVYATDINDLHKLMAVLFRPIMNKDIVGNYKIIQYEGTERYAKIMKHMPMSIVNGALVFFSNLANELLDYTQKYMQVEQVKEE